MRKWWMRYDVWVVCMCTGKTTFLSIASYRDENCPNTITEAFKYVSVSVYIRTYRTCIYRCVDRCVYQWSDSSCVYLR